MVLVTDVVVGIDPSKRKLGWGVVMDADGSPGPCGVAELDGSPQATWAAIADLDVLLDAHGWNPVLVYVEYPFGGKGGGHGIFESGVAVGLVEMAARRFWPSAAIDRIGSMSWRPKVGLRNRAPRDAGDSRKWLKAQDVLEAQRLGFKLPLTGVRVIRHSDDAADGALIARAAWLDLEAGVVHRLAA